MKFDHSKKKIIEAFLIDKDRLDDVAKIISDVFGSDKHDCLSRRVEKIILRFNPKNDNELFFIGMQIGRMSSIGSAPVIEVVVGVSKDEAPIRKYTKKDLVN